MAKTLIAVLARHGDTDVNDADAFRSRLDPPLNKNGERQAEAIARFVQKYNVYKIISSPMLRAVQTADIVNEVVKAKVKQDRGLMPWHLGFMGGRDKKLYGPILDFFVDNPKLVIPEGESLDEFEERTDDFFRAALKCDYREAPSGDPITGYAEDGPYHCEDCIHKTKKDAPYCVHPKILDNPRMKDRLVKISGVRAAKISLERGCCEYVKPKEDAKDAVQLFICHTSNVVALDNLFRGDHKGRPESGEESVGTGGIAEVHLSEGEYSLTPVFGKTTEAEFGS